MTFATDQKLTTAGLSNTSAALLDLRDAVFERWLTTVRDQVPGARDIARPILVDTLPMLYDNLAEALTPEYPRALATTNTTLGQAHGGERARMTDYGSDQVIHEYHLLRDAILEICQQHQVVLTKTELAAIDSSINTAVRESVRAFLKKQQELREQMAATLSHDMRTPLSVIHSGAQLIAKTTNLTQANSVGQKLVNHSQHLIEMVDQLIDALTFDRASAVSLDITRFDIYKMAAEVCEGLCGPTSIVELSGPSVEGYWCKKSLRRALENLIVNAQKYGDGSQITVRIEETMGRMMLTVHNTGNPIAQDERERIFEYLARQHSLRHQGWGIGLPFVQAVVEAHGGSVAVDSSEAAGTTFVIDLPVDGRIAG